MAGFINSFKQKSVDDTLLKLHETFAQDIVVYKNAIGVSINSSAQYNSLYKNAGASNSVQYETVQKTFKARIYYVKFEQEFFYGTKANSSNDKVILPQGLVKIIVDQEAYLFIREARKITFDDKTFSIRSAGNHTNPDGFFSNILYEFQLIPLNE
jgi:hypothetical protein